MQTYCKIIAYGNWLFSILILLATLEVIAVKHIYINAASRILTHSHEQGVQQLNDMGIYAQNTTLGSLLLLSSCMVANGSLFFWLGKKIKLKYDDQ